MKITQYTLENLGNMGKKLYGTFQNKCSDKIKALRPDVEEDMEQIIDGGNFFSNLFK